MKRTAEIIDLATGDARKTGKGAVFVGEAECDFRIRNLRENDAGKDARFLVDIHDERGDILETLGLDEAGFEALTGEAPLSPEKYAEYDNAYWGAIRGVAAERDAERQKGGSR